MIKYLLSLAVVIASTYQVRAQSDISVFSKMVDGQEVADPNEEQEKHYPAVENLVRALRTYKGLDNNQPYTIFVPNNEAFKRAPKGTIGYFVKEQNKKALDEFVSFHVIVGKLSKRDIMDRIAQAKGEAILKTISGFKIKATSDKEGNIILINEAGRLIHITATNFGRGSGTIHIVDSVIIPYDAGLAEEDARQYGSK